ncbi:hypothetical protein EK21DRAFT_89671 [Setomelanomma holmii]|uniref:Uncharacterized protein n=1 Tax=Setomelanomma holmii TaxID=210430 RepID=A0A9P4LLU8_9PLEO|nr:hypothetical protein EK21DRAFT_89671 [Setomelanomma holmii]
MAPQHALVALLSFAATTFAQTSTSTYNGSAFWTYTSRYAALASPSPYTRGNGVVTTYTITDRMRTVKPSVTPTATPTSTTTYYSTYADLEIEYQYYGINAVAESDLLPKEDYYNSASTTSTLSAIAFSMPVTMTAPASCPTQFTVTTTASVTVPSQVWDRVTPVSKASASTTTRSTYVYIYETWYLSAGAAPFTTTSDIYYRLYVASCSTPPGARASSTSTARSGGGDSSSSGSRYCYSYYYCDTPLKVWIIIIASVIPGLFLLGFLESWFWFRRLMLGKSAMRFGTVCWVLISLWVLCFTRMQDARSKEDQKLLQEKWKNMGSGAAFKAWWKWGFRHSYPVEHLGQFSKTTVGIVPAGQPLHPAMAQAPPPLFTPGAPLPAWTSGGPYPPPGAPGQPGQVYYYGPPPPGWVSTPDGHGFMPPQGHAYPLQQGGYYSADAAKNGTTVSSSPVSALGPQQPYHQPGSPVDQTPPPPQAPQPVYPAPNIAQMPASSPPPQGATPNVQPAQATAPPANVSEASGESVQRPVNMPQHLPPKSDPNDRSL